MRKTQQDAQQLRVRDIRTLPFVWIQRALYESIRPNWKGILAYNALCYYAAGQSGVCRDIGIKLLADRVGVSVDTMRRGLDELERRKAIKVNARYKTKKIGKTQQLPNEYILVDLIEPIQPI